MLEKRVFGTRKSWPRRLWTRSASSIHAHGQESGDVCRRGGRCASSAAAHRQHHQPPGRLASTQITSGVGHGALCQLLPRPWRGRGKAQATRYARPRAKTIATAALPTEGLKRCQRLLRLGDVIYVEANTTSPAWRGHRRRGIGGMNRLLLANRPGHPRGRGDRRLSRRHKFLGLDQGPHHLQPGETSSTHDRPH